jgi:hypothetical protein
MIWQPAGYDFDDYSDISEEWNTVESDMSVPNLVVDFADKSVVWTWTEADMNLNGATPISYSFWGYDDDRRRRLVDY